MRWGAASALGIIVLMLLASLGAASPSAAQAPGNALVPSIAGLPEADAQATITSAGLTVGVSTGSAYDVAIPLGHVLTSDPPAGTEVLLGTTVNYTLSAGPPPQTLQPTPTPTPTPAPTPKPPKSPKPRPTPWPTPPGIKGVDVSHWNGAPNFQQLRAEGMEFVFSKASQGTTIQDATYLRNTQEARAAGLHAGAYHFFDYRKSGKPQARYFLDTLRATTGLDGLLPLVVDVETLKSLGDPEPAKAKARLHALINELYRQTGRYPMIYTSREMWKRVVGEPDEFGGYRLWVACWKCDKVHLPRGWNGWHFWQVGQFRFADGARLDGNTFTSSRDRLRLEVGRPMILDGGAEWANTTAVEADLRGFDGGEVRVALDGGGFGPWAPYQQPFPVQLSGKQGARSVQLQLRSFRNTTSPVLGDDILLDSVPPKVKGPRIGILPDTRLAPSGKKVPIIATMSASDKTSGLVRSKLVATCKGKKRAGRSRADASVEISATINRTGCAITGAGKDNVGLTGTRQLNPRINLADARGRSGQVSLKGTWRTSKAKKALGRTLAQTSTRGARARVVFKGEQFAVVARRGPTGGNLQVIVDGKKVAVISLYANKTDDRRVVYVGSVPKRKHVVTLRATGTADPASRGTTVALDAVLLLDRRK